MPIKRDRKASQRSRRQRERRQASVREGHTDDDLLRQIDRVVRRTSVTRHGMSTVARQDIPQDDAAQAGKKHGNGNGH